jgi:hypothetical protein
MASNRMAHQNRVFRALKPRNGPPVPRDQQTTKGAPKGKPASLMSRLDAVAERYPDRDEVRVLERQKSSAGSA